MRLKYIETAAHGRSLNNCIESVIHTHLGYIVNEQFSIYQNQNSRSGMVGYWHIIHNDSKLSIGLVKNRKDVYTVLASFDSDLFSHVSLSEYGFAQWDDQEAKDKMKATWRMLKDQYILF